MTPPDWFPLPWVITEYDGDVSVLRDARGVPILLVDTDTARFILDAVNATLDVKGKSE